VRLFVGRGDKTTDTGVEGLATQAGDDAAGRL